MTDLPDDIWETALQTWQKAHVMSLHEDQVRILAEAILAERERCEAKTRAKPKTMVG